MGDNTFYITQQLVFGNIKRKGAGRDLEKQSKKRREGEKM